MKIILLKDVKKQGKKGDILEVASGYGNFLIKSGEAVMATEGSIKRLQKENAESALAQNLEIKECQKIKEQIEKIKIKIPVKTGVQDRVFGSVSTKQICSVLEKQGLTVDKRKIHVENELTSLGSHIVSIELHKQVKANLKVELVKES